MRPRRSSSSSDIGPTAHPEDYEEKRLSGVEELRELQDNWPLIWVNVIGLGNLEIIKALGDLFDLHRLAMEDVLNVNQRSKVEEYPNSLFMALRHVVIEPGLSSEQISLFVGKRFVLSFQERPGDCFDAIRDRLRKGKRRIRTGADYLAYALLDAVIDHFFPILETYGERLEEIEDEVLEAPDNATISRLHAIKRDLVLIRRAVSPMREMATNLLQEDLEYFQGENALFVRDCYDHVLQVIEQLGHYRDVASGLADVYLSCISNRMNEVMRVLTLIATIFIPLSFIAGVYGMNFKYMPELESAYGYYIALLVMVLVAIGFLYYFKRKKWL